MHYRDKKITFDMCTPRLLWIPEHCMHIKIPKFTLAHLGPLQRNEAIISTYDKNKWYHRFMTESTKSPYEDDSYFSICYYDIHIISLDFSCDILGFAVSTFPILWQFKKTFKNLQTSEVKE